MTSRSATCTSRLVNLTVALLLVSGCTSGKRDLPPVPGGLSVQSPAHEFVQDRVMALDKFERRYRMFLPVQADGSAPLPLVLVLHGTGDSGSLIQSFSGFDRVAAQAGFLVAYPDSWNGAWNARLPQEYAARTGAADDVRFLSALVDDVAAIHPVDRRAVYVTGHSSGGRMAYRLICERPDVFAAAAPVSGGLVVAAPCEPSRPVSLLQIEGQNDYTRAEAEAGVEVLREVNRCSGRPRVERVDTVNVTHYAPCDGGVDVAYASIPEWGHGWPGGLIFDASGEAWRFLSQHRRSAPAPEN